MSALFKKLNKYLHYGPLFKIPRRIIKHIMSAIYPLVIRIWKLPNVKSIEETINKIKNDGCSIARYGDSEILYIVNHLNLPYQEYDSRLGEILAEILISNDPKLLVGLQDSFISVKPFDPYVQTFWRSQISYMYPRFQKFLNLEKQYWNANISRLYFGYVDKARSARLFDLVRSLWINREILLVEGEKSRLGVGNDLFATAVDVKRILGPAHHAFRQYDNLKAEVMKYPKNKLILIAMGPTAKALSYELTKEGYQCVDIGNLDLEYEWFKLGVADRVKIKGKYTSEVAGGRIVDDIDDPDYVSQVIAQCL